MADKTIAQLSAKEPLNTDLVPVADPVTGIAGKSTALSIYQYDSSTRSFPYTLTPTPTFLDNPWQGNFTNRIQPLNRTTYKIPVIDGQELFFNSETAAGYTIGPQTPSPENTVTAITFNDEIPNGSTGSITVRNFCNATSVSGPTTKGLGIDIQNFYKMTTFSFPEALYGFIQFTSINDFSSVLTLPKMKYLDRVNISNASKIAGISFPELTHAGSFQLNPSTTTVWPNFSTINLPKLKYSGYLQFKNMPSITSLSFPELEMISTETYDTNFNCAHLLTLNLPKLKIANNIISNAATTQPITTINIPLLQYLQTGIFDYVSNGNYANLVTLSAPELVYHGSVTKAQSATVVDTYTYSMNSSNIDILSAPLLTTINLPKLKFYGGVTNVRGVPSLTTFTINSTPKFYTGNFTCTGAALNQASVDGILVALAYMDGTANAPYPAYSSKTINLSGGTSATPSATGLAAKATLVARGCTVTHN